MGRGCVALLASPPPKPLPPMEILDICTFDCMAGAMKAEVAARPQIMSERYSIVLPSQKR